VLRILDALQTGGLCPANWTSADGTIDPEKALQPGRILGRYRIQRLVGSGSFGSVFAAWDLRLARMVALKVLKRDVFGARDVALAEARAAAALNCPNACTIYAVDEEDGLPVIAMEYLDGQSLSQVIEQGLEHRDALELASQIAAGLAAAHEQNVIHGDLKPANVIVTENRIAKIVDFGLANASSAGADNECVEPPSTPVTGAGAATARIDATVECVPAGSSSVIRGTPAYMSPEQASAMPATPASDVFSFGLMLYEMLTGRPAHPERPILETLHVLQNKDLGPELAQQVEEPHRELLMAMLARDAARRPMINDVLQSINDMT
jgi:serine/threonine protein kinase